MYILCEWKQFKWNGKQPSTSFLILIKFLVVYVLTICRPSIFLYYNLAQITRRFQKIYLKGKISFRMIANKD